MRKFLLATAAIVTMSSGALAADLPVRGPAIAPAPIFVGMNWTGFYVGINAGGAFGETAATELGAPFAGYNGLGSRNKYNSSGWTGGLTAGYNWQGASSFVLGVEADVNYLDRSKSSAGFTLNGAQDTFLNTKHGIFATLRARAGVSFGNALLYVTGGVAGIEHGTSVVDTNPAGTTIATSKTGFRVGWTAGAGLEYAVSGNWSVKAEYLYVDTGSSTVSGLIAGVGPARAGWRVKHEDHIVRLGLNYRFGGPVGAVVAKY